MKSALDSHSKFSKAQILEFINSIKNPVLITFIDPESHFPISVPIWTVFENENFYIMGGRMSKRVKSIKAGNKNFSLTIVNTDSYPHIASESIPYLLIYGKAKIIDRQTEFTNTEINLLEKYNNEDPEEWALKRIAKLNEDPSDVWLVQIKPQKVYIYDW